MLQLNTSQVWNYQSAQPVKFMTNKKNPHDPCIPAAWNMSSVDEQLPRVSHKAVLVAKQLLGTCSQRVCIHWHPVGTEEETRVLQHQMWWWRDQVLSRSYGKECYRQQGGKMSTSAHTGGEAKEMEQLSATTQISSAKNGRWGLPCLRPELLVGCSDLQGLEGNQRCVTLILLGQFVLFALLLQASRDHRKIQIHVRERTAGIASTLKDHKQDQDSSVTSFCLFLSLLRVTGSLLHASETTHQELLGKGRAAIMEKGHLAHLLVQLREGFWEGSTRTVRM